MEERRRLARNFQALIDKNKLQGQEKIAQFCGISQGHVSNILDSRKSTGIDKIEQIARAFKLRAWQLLAPEEVFELGLRPEVAQLIENFTACDEAGQKIILGVARAQAQTRGNFDR